MKNNKLGGRRSFLKFRNLEIYEFIKLCKNIFQVSMSEPQQKSIFTIGDFEYIPITPSYEEQALEILSYSFTNFDPSTIYSKIPQEVYKEFGRNVLDSYRARELSVVCIYNQTSEVCGVALSNEINPDFPVEYTDSVNHYLKEIFLIMIQLDENISIDWDHACYYNSLAVDSKWKGNQIGLNLTRALEKHAKNKGFSLIKAEAMNPTTQHILFDQLEYTECNPIKYDESEYNGEKLFPGLEGYCSLAYKNL